MSLILNPQNILKNRGNKMIDKDPVGIEKEPPICVLDKDTDE